MEPNDDKSTKNDAVSAIKKSCEEVSKVERGKTNEMGASLNNMIITYYGDVRKQARQSFIWALVASGVATLFFIYASYLYMFDKLSLSANISLIGGALIEIIAGINFFLYGKAARQFSSFHICLERTNRYLLANTICDNIDCPIKKDDTRQALVASMMNAPMLTLDPPKRIGHRKKSIFPKNNGNDKTSDVFLEQKN